MGTPLLSERNLLAGHSLVGPKYHLNLILPWICNSPSLLTIREWHNAHLSAGPVKKIIKAGALVRPVQAGLLICLLFVFLQVYLLWLEVIDGTTCLICVFFLNLSGAPRVLDGCVFIAGQ